MVRSLAGKSKTIRNFTASGLSKMLQGMNRKTIVPLLDDLVHLGLIEKHDLGKRQTIKVLPTTEDHLELFAPPVKHGTSEDTVPVEVQRPTSNKYEYKDDGFDEFRRVCEGLMPQSWAERAIRACRILDWDFTDFQIAVENARLKSEENVRTGKCPVQNFGKYFVQPLEDRAKAIIADEKRQEAEDRRRQYEASPEGKRARADRDAEIAADPLHRLHSICVESVTDRVQFSQNLVENRLAAERLLRRVSDHCHQHIGTKGLDFQRQIDEAGNLREKIMATALSRAERLLPPADPRRTCGIAGRR